MRDRTAVETAPAHSEAPAAPPVFVVGCPRSGTTLLRLMLDAHPSLSIPPESHFIPQLWGARRRYITGGRFEADRMVRDLVGTARFREWDLPPDAVRERVRALPHPTFAGVVDAVFAAYAEQQGKRRWGDKTPGYSLEMPLLARLFPHARFVHLIRDGRDVALSFFGVIGPKTMAEAAEVWRHRIEIAQRDGAALGSERYTEVRYEDLVADPEAALAPVCAFLGLEQHPGMLRYSERIDRTIPGSERRIHQNLAKPPTKGLRDWRRDMAPADVETFEAIAGRELARLGYERAVPRLGIGARVRARKALARIAASRTTYKLRRRAFAAVKRGALPPPRRW